MRIASLPMYDLEEVRAGTDAWWAGLARALRRERVEDVPGRLTRGEPFNASWRHPDLLFSQTCGYPLIHGYADDLRPLATPCYAAPGCEGSAYSSFIVVAETSAAAALEDLRGKICAVNHADSHSGMNALRALIAPLSRNGCFFAAIKITGEHRNSLALVARGEADVAAIDCVTYALLERHHSAALAGTRKLGTTMTAPANPYVTRAGASDDLALRLRAGLERATADPDLAAARGALLITGFETVPRAAYDRIDEFERLAVTQGYPELR